jgi:beta-ketodecanoyl-[acyl-carrier-protein] synthase
VLVVNPEITSGHLNWRDRDSHFIFGDVATAILVESKDLAPAQHWEILGTRLKTQYSNNIRNNFGFLNRAEGKGPVDQSGPKTDKLFVQEGRKVFKEVVPMVAQMIVDHAAHLGLKAALRRLWLHQANQGMNRLISQRVLGHEANEDESPTVLDTYANTSSAGSIIAFHKHSEDLKAGDTGLICSFGRGLFGDRHGVPRAYGPVLQGTSHRHRNDGESRWQPWFRRIHRLYSRICSRPPRCTGCGFR